MQLFNRQKEMKAHMGPIVNRIWSMPFIPLLFAISLMQLLILPIKELNGLANWLKQISITVLIVINNVLQYLGTTYRIDWTDQVNCAKVDLVSSLIILFCRFVFSENVRSVDLYSFIQIPFFRNWAIPGLFFVCFCSFSNKTYNFYNNIM